MKMLFYPRLAIGFDFKLSDFGPGEAESLDKTRPVSVSILLTCNQLLRDCLLAGDIIIFLAAHAAL